MAEGENFGVRQSPRSAGRRGHLPGLWTLTAQVRVLALTPAMQLAKSLNRPAPQFPHM